MDNYFSHLRKFLSKKISNIPEFFISLGENRFINSVGGLDVLSLFIGAYLLKPALLLGTP